MMRSITGKWLVGGTFMRIFYAIVKAMTFCWLALIQPLPAIAPEHWAEWGSLLIRVGEAFVYLAVALCLVRGLPVVVEFVQGTKCTLESGFYTKNPPLLHPFGITKKEIAERLSHDFKISLENTVALADSRWDLPLLEVVGTAIAVRPDSALERAARAHRWEVIRPEKRWLRRLKWSVSEQGVYERRDGGSLGQYDQGSK